VRRVKTLQPVRPNVGIARSYQRRLDKLIEEMHNSLVYWLRAAYRKRPPEMHRLAQDASPARTLQSTFNGLRRRWEKRFDEQAQELAKYFTMTAAQRSDAALKSILKRGGMSVEFVKTRAVNDVLAATIHENVSLIRSIAAQHLGAVEQMVARSVHAGRDLGMLTDQLQQQFGVTKRRAALIARDQNNKATAQVQRVRHLELGIKEAIWLHSGGGREPRPSHVKAGREQMRYDLSKGWFDPEVQRYIFPGELISCRCVSRPVIEGFV
jgi:uncharacterized protein with gpF-like domain